MSTVTPISLLAAGCQPWNVNVSAASPTGDRFAYCATLAVYIYQYDRKFKEFKLHSIMSEHKKTITALSWNHKDSDLIVTASADREIIIWNIPQQKIMNHINKLQAAPVCVGWYLQETNCIGFISGRGPLYLWNYSNVGGGLTFHKEASSFQSEVCQFRWHPKTIGKLVLGHVDGTISVVIPRKKTQKHILPSIDAEDDPDEEEDPVVALEWDTLSSEYLLVATTHNGIRLLDTDAQSVIMKFQLPSVAAQVHTLAWVNNAPGVFLTGDTHNGIMRIWSVAKSQPLESMKLKKTGFHCLNILTTPPGLDEDSDSESQNRQCNSFGVPTMSQAGRYALPPAFVVCTFMDGGVGLYDLGKRRWCFLRNEGHIETIFDCKFKPDSVDLLATASFDGSIKIWDVNKMTCVNSSPGNEGVIYCLSWAPADLNAVAASTSKNGAFIWDVTKGRVIKRFVEHGNHSVFSVAWNQKDSGRIATCAGDGLCIVRLVDGTLVAKFKHPAPVFGCDWSPNNKDIIATGCDDKCVRVFYIPTAQTNDGKPLRVFKGHEAKVFNVRWSPLRDGLLCSGSDDGTVRVWDYTKDNCTMVLQAHSGPVRGLLWNTEIPYMLISGSWDYTLRIWDIRDGACLDTVLDHGADVYGITSHPERPFIFASSSRDSTVRLWSLNPLIQPIEMNILAEKPWDDFALSPEHSMSMGTPPILCGKASKEIRAQLEKVSGDKLGPTLRLFSKFFSTPCGSTNLWELVAVVRNMHDSMLSPDYHKGIMHTKHLTKFKAGRAKELEMAKKYGAGVGQGPKEDKLREAAEINLQIGKGNVYQYCETMMVLGEWDKALAMAPAVSLEYWKNLTETRVKLLKQEDSEEVVPYAVAIGDVETLISFFTAQGKLQEAMVVATAGYEGNIVPPVTGKSKRGSAVNGVVDHNEQETLQLLHKTSNDLAEWYFRNGLPVLAACCHLAVDDTEKALCKLLRGNELEIAVSVGKVLKNHPSQTNLGIEYLSRRCERLGKWDLAVDLLKNIPKSQNKLAQLCARCAASMAEINDLHQRAGFPPMDECLRLAEESNDVVERVQYYMLSTQPDTGLEIGLKYVKKKLGSSTWYVEDVWDVLQMMAAVQTEKLQQHKCAKYRGELLVLCAYVGALVAVRREYNSVVPSLFSHVLYLLKRDNEIEIPVSESLVSSELDSWQFFHQPARLQKNQSEQREKQNIYENLLLKSGPETCPVGLGMDFVSGSQLPCHSDVHDSFFTNVRIQGPAFFLEDGRSAIPISEALMWAKVTPFSPLGSGVRINPF